MEHKIAAIILAAGMSRRAGNINKLLAPIDGAPMLCQVVDVVLESPCDPVLVITGHEAGRVESALTGKDVTFVVNPDYQQGMAASVRAGVQALGADVDGVLICLGDMPHIQPHTFEALIENYDPARKAEICIPSFDGRRGNPVLFGRRFFADLEAIEGDVGGRPVVQKNRAFINDVPVDDPGIHIDHDVV